MHTSRIWPVAEGQAQAPSSRVALRVLRANVATQAPPPVPPIFLQVLLPTLVSVCYGNEHICVAVSQHMSMQWLQDGVAERDEQQVGARERGHGRTAVQAA